MNTNIYNQKRERFFKNNFPYEKKLITAIQYTNPMVLSVHCLTDIKIKNVQNIDNKSELLKLINRDGFNLNIDWSYSYMSIFEITDWCSMYWNNRAGLCIHFEWMGMDYLDDYSQDVDMDFESWQFFLDKRKQLFANFYPELYLNIHRNEDIVVQLTDHELLPLNKSKYWIGNGSCFNETAIKRKPAIRRHHKR